MPPLAPMLSKSVKEIPDVGHVEPKWDGFRTIVFKDGDEIELGSRNERPMTRYFPELVDALRENLPPRCVVDGEIILVTDGRLDFDALQQRIHPADSRVRMLAEQTPASFVAFDLLAIGDDDLMGEPFADRRRGLVEALAAASDPVFVTPATADLAEANDWFTRFEGAGLDGVVAKPLDGTYQPDKRTMFKVKHERTADCVVAGFRWHKTGGIVGSLLLGLYDDDGRLHHVGVAASFPMARRASLVAELEPLIADDLSQHPWGEWADQEAHAVDADAGRGEPVERRQEPLVRAPAPRARRRGGLRADGGRPVPPHGAVPTVAHRPHARELHLRAARVARRPRPVGDPAVAELSRFASRMRRAAARLRAPRGVPRRARCGARTPGSSR